MYANVFYFSVRVSSSLDYRNCIGDGQMLRVQRSLTRRQHFSARLDVMAAIL